MNDELPQHRMEWGWYWETPTKMRVFGQVTVRGWLIEYKQAKGQETAIALLPSLKEQVAQKLGCSVEQINAAQLEINPDPIEP